MKTGKQPQTVGALSESDYRSRSTKQEMRENLIERLRSGGCACARRGGVSVVRLLAALVIVTLTSGCGSVYRLDWTSMTQRTYAPLGAHADIEVWVEPPPRGLWAMVRAADNPRIGTGPPGCVPIASTDVEFESVLVWPWDRRMAWGFPFPAPSPRKDALAEARARARELGGDALVMRRGKNPPYRCVIDVVRSRP